MQWINLLKVKKIIQHLEYFYVRVIKKITAELSLKDVNKPIGVSEYKILSEIPEYLESTLPSIEDIEKRLEANDIEEI